MGTLSSFPPSTKAFTAWRLKPPLSPAGEEFADEAVKSLTDLALFPSLEEKVHHFQRMVYFYQKMKIFLNNGNKKLESLS